MNRIPLLSPSQAKQPVSSPSALSRAWDLRSSQVNPQYSLYVPLHYERNYAYPLLIWLHGPSDDERQLRTIMRHISVRNYVGVAPRGTHDNSAEGGVGHAWQQTDREIYEAQDRVEECIELATQRMNIARHRIFIGGFGCGGTMALRLATLDPTRYAGAISISGPFPEGGAPLARLDQLRRLPLFIAHGCDSSYYPSAQLCAQLRMFSTAHIKVNVFEYPCGDDVTTKMLSNLDAWMMERVTGIAHEPSDASQPTFFGTTNPN